MFTQRDIIEQLKQLSNEIVSKGINLKKVILYGSYAKNLQREDSDIDVAIVADEFIGFAYEDIKLINDILLKNINIQPKTYPTEYFNQGDPFIEEIKKTGIEIPVG